MRFALVGCDAQGMAYAAALAELGLDVSVCADDRLAAARKAATICGAKPSNNCTTTIDTPNVGAVVLCGASSNAVTLRRAARHKKHVLSTVPLSQASITAKALDAVLDARVVLYVAHDGRAAPEEAAIARQLDQGVVGKPGFVKIHRSTDANGAAIEDILPRDLDWLLGRFGSSPRIYAHAFAKQKVAHAAVALTFGDGPIVQWIATRGAPTRARIEVCGTGGMLEFSTDDHVIDAANVTAKGISPVLRASPIARNYALRHMIHFLTAIEIPSPERTCKHEQDIVRATEAALRSARNGVEVRL